MSEPRAFLFDAYGTLFDVHSVVPKGELAELSKLWRQKQLEYTWLRSLMDRYEDFWEVTEAALVASAAQLQIPLSDIQRGALMQAYLTPAAFSDAKPALESLAHAPRAILSNGSPKMLQAMVRHNGFDRYFSEIISADRVKTYKPSPRVYALGPEILKLPAGQILFISSNAWDAAGAKAFGYTVCWCNRSGAAPEELGISPDFTVRDLHEAAKLFC